MRVLTVQFLYRATAFVVSVMVFKEGVSLNPKP